MKHLHYEECDDVDDLIYGHSDLDDKTIHINIGYLWHKFKDVDKFIQNFCDTYNHEMVHLVIDELAPKYKCRPIYGEEKAVRHLLRERFTRRRRYYYSH
jgi:hypothetical protein